MNKPLSLALATLLLTASLICTGASTNASKTAQTQLDCSQFATADLNALFKLVSQEPGFPPTVLTQMETRLSTITHMTPEDPHAAAQIHEMGELAANSAAGISAAPQAAYDELLRQLGQIQQQQTDLYHSRKRQLETSTRNLLISRIASIVSAALLLLALLQRRE